MLLHKIFDISAVISPMAVVLAILRINISSCLFISQQEKKVKE